MKTDRQSKILEIIQKEGIETQEDLAKRLEEEGFPSTQATISRDIRELRIVKTLGANSQYQYAVPSEGSDSYLTRLRSIFRDSVISCDYAQNIVVLKTLPGLASAACSALDSMKFEPLVGTLAGDDTAFLLMRDTEAAQTLIAEIQKML